MRNLAFAVSGALALTIATLQGLSSAQAPPPLQPDQPVLYENARLIPGDGGAVIERAALLVDQRVVVRVGPAGTITVPASVRRVDLTGKTIMPASILNSGSNS